MLRQVIGAALIISVAPLAAQTPPSPPEHTVQQDFQAATQLQEAKNYVGALAAWEALEKRVADRPRNLAIVQARKSVALAGLDRADDAVAAARAGLAGLPKGDASLLADRFNAYYTIASLSERSLDYAGAAEAYRQAEQIAPTPSDGVAVLRGLIETETFTDPDRALADMNRAEAFVAPLTLGPDAKAVLKRVKSQLLMNRGDFRGAQAEAGEAVKLLGGLTTRIDLYDVAARSNYAIAALLAGKDEEARKYMAYTGAGRLPKGSFDPGVQMKVPDCGGEAALKPSDVAVVEFTVNDDGTIAAASPIYAAGGGAVGLEFARAVRSWSFRPEQVKEMPTFFRYRARVELRCSAAFERPSIGDYLDTELDRWLISQQIALPLIAAGSDAAVLPALRAELARSEAKGPQSLAVLPALHALAKNRVVPRDEASQFARRALVILRASNAPGTAQLAIDRLTWMGEKPDSWKPAIYGRTATAALRADGYTKDIAADAAGRIMLADALRADPKRARALLAQAAGTTALPANHPLRVAALVRLASLEQAEGQPEAARAAFEQSGLSARQCALLDAPPRLKAVGGTFPQEALLWGFEGWTQVEYDIAATGAVQGERVVVAYPPFVFTKAGAATMRGAKYEKTFRPDGSLGCGGTSNRVRFILSGQRPQ